MPKSQIFKTKLRKFKKDTSDKVNKIRQETTKLIDKFGEEIERHEKEQDSAEGG